MDRRVLIGSGIAALIVVLVWYVALWSPRNRTYKAARSQAETAQSQVSQLQAQLGRLQADSRQRPQLEAELAKLYAAVPGTPQLAQIFLQIDNAALQSGVTLTTISPSPPVAATPSSAPASTAGAPTATATPPPSISVSLVLGGGYYQILDFIDRLDSLPRLIVLNSVAINGGSAASSGPELTASITAHMFVSQLPPTPSATGTGTAATTTTTAAPGATTTSTVGGTTSTTSAAGGATTTTTTTAAARP